MRMQNKNKKKATPFEVASAKMPPWLFAKLEEFRYENELRTRNAAVNILIMLALATLGEFDKAKCTEFMGTQGMPEVPATMLSALSVVKGEI